MVGDSQHHQDVASLLMHQFDTIGMKMLMGCVLWEQSRPLKLPGKNENRSGQESGEQEWLALADTEGSHRWGPGAPWTRRPRAGGDPERDRGQKALPRMRPGLAPARQVPTSNLRCGRISPASVYLCLAGQTRGRLTPQTPRHEASGKKLQGGFQPVAPLPPGPAADDCPSLLPQPHGCPKHQCGRGWPVSPAVRTGKPRLCPIVARCSAVGWHLLEGSGHHTMRAAAAPRLLSRRRGEGAPGWAGGQCSPHSPGKAPRGQ